MVYHLSTPWVLSGPWFSVYPTCEYYSDHGFPKSTAIAAIPPKASIQQERVHIFWHSLAHMPFQMVRSMLLPTSFKKYQTEVSDWF